MSTNKYLGVDPMLTNVAIGYVNDTYIAEQVMPSFAVAKQSGKHFIYDKGRFRNTPNKRAAGSPSNEVTLTLTTGNPYFAEDHALKQFVPDEDVENAITPTDPYVDATENVTERHLIARELEVATMMTDTAQLTQNITLSGTSQFNDYSNSDPFATIDTGLQTIHSSIHIVPNTLIVGRQVWDKLKYLPAFLERVKYSQKGVITPDLLASLIGVDRVIVAGAGYNNTKEGQTDSMSYIWGKNAILAYIAPRIAPKLMTLGLTYTWQQMQTERLRGTDEEDRKGTYIRGGNFYYDQNLVSASAGYLVKNAIT
jgi:hypothetical protein